MSEQHQAVLVPVKVALEMLGGISRPSLYDLISAGQLPEPVQVGGRTMFVVTELIDAVAAMPRGRREQRNTRNRPPMRPAA